MINQKYKINKLLGKGRSSVYLCEDIDLPGQDIAIKILPENAEETEERLFLNEYFTLRKINHPNIVKAFDIGTITRTDGEYADILPGSKFFTLEYINGCSLLEYDGSNDKDTLYEIIKQLSMALYYLHLSNFIYYDLKPENILVTVSDRKPIIKLIDLGFAQCIVKNKEPVIRGTAEYIAPEILKNEKHDYRVDFYSLGMVLYRLIYRKFPFDTKNEVDVYKAHIEQDFDFPEASIPTGIIDVIKKLLKKDPEERYTNAIQILNDLNIEIGEEQIKGLLPAKVFAGRKDCLTILKTYIADQGSREVFTVRGPEGAGKTALAYQLYSSVENSILIDNSNSLTVTEYFRQLFKKITNHNLVYPKLSAGLIQQIDKFYNNLPLNPADEVKAIINRLSIESAFVLILDSFNSYDDLLLEVLRDVIPILQVNRIKVILMENSDRHIASEFISNLREINLTPFTEAQLSEYLEKSFASYFPIEQLKQLILSYADLLPGSLESFIKDLILLKIIRYTSQGIEIVTDERTSSILKSSHEEIYKIRISGITEEELPVARFISAFEIVPGINVIGRYFNLDDKAASRVLESLSRKNVIQSIISGLNPVFTSEGLKKYVYSGINGKQNLHSLIAEFLIKLFPDYNRGELARQYELAGHYEDSYKILKEELNKAEKISAYSFQKNILQHLLTYPLSEENNVNVNVEYCKVLTNLNDYRVSLNHIDQIINIVTRDAKNELSILKAKCLIGLGELNEGKTLLESLISKFPKSPASNTLLLDLANVNFNLNNYDETIEICNKLTGIKDIDNETLGSACQLLGLISIYKDDDLDSALKYFEKTNLAYQSGGHIFRQAGILMNIGNIYSMRGEDKHALEYWNRSLNLNQSIGNIQQEAKLLINFGIYYFNSLEFDKSTENYTKAFSIFNSLGIKDGQGLVETNLGEIFLLMCEYQKSFESLDESIDIFRNLQNKEEELQAFFLLGKLYYTIGDFERLNQLLKEFEFKVQAEPSETHKNNYKYLLTLSKTTGTDLNSILQSLTDIRTNFSIEERKYDYFHCTMVIISIMIKLNILDEAAGELRSEELINLCRGNNFFEAERNYLFGVICEHNPLLGTKSAVDYYLTAHELILDLHITELTWKILYALFKVFSNRGNIDKSREYGRYSNSLIRYIADNIKDHRLRSIYLDENERKTALKELNYYEEQF